LFTPSEAQAALNTWDTLTAAPDTVSVGGALVYLGSGDTIYAFRGNTFTDFWGYNTKTNAWTTLTAAPATVYSGGALVYPGSGDTIYAFRGFTTTAFWGYNTKTNAWTTMTAAPATVDNGGALVYPGSGDTIYAFGGNTTTNFWGYTVPFYAGPTWYVNDASTAGDSFTTAVGDTTGDGSSARPFLTITKALTKAKAGDTIYIDAGTYTETVVIDVDSVALIGKDSGATVIDPPGSNATAGLYGIYADTQTGLTIKNLGVTGAYDGIYFINVDLSSISGDSFGTNGGHGVNIIDGSDSNTITANDAGGNSLQGIYLATNSNNNAVTNNTVGLNAADGILVANCSNDTLSGNTTDSNSGRGIMAQFSSRIAVINNRVLANIDGIKLQGCTTCLVSGNVVLSNSYGIVLDPGSNNITVRNNHVNSNVNDGILVVSSDTNLIAQNDVSGHSIGVSLSGSSRNNIVTKNNITNSSNKDLSNYTGLAQTVSRNWWGSVDTASIKSKITDTVNAFTPFRIGTVDTAAGADTTAPKAPDTVSVACAGTSCTVTWSAVSANEEGVTWGGDLSAYRVYRQTTKYTANWKDTTGGNGRLGQSSGVSFVDTSAGQTNYYRVTAFDAGTPYENESFFSDSIIRGGAVDTPRIYAGTYQNTGTVKITWTFDSEEQGAYEIQVDTGLSPDWANLADNVSKTAGSITSRLTASLTRGQWFTARMRVWTAGDDTSPWSDSVAFYVLKRFSDGDASDWAGTPGTDSDAGSVSGGEYIWVDRIGDVRADPVDPDGDMDLTQFRVTADTYYVYFMFQTANWSANRALFSMALDVTRNASDTGMNWLGDDANGFLGRGGEQYSEVNLDASDNAPDSAVWIYLDTAVAWNRPSSGPAYDWFAKTTEIAVKREDIKWSPGDTLRISLAVGEQNSSVTNPQTGDNSVNFTLTDFLDDLYPGAGAGAWSDDLSDTDLDYYVDVYFGSDGEVRSNAAPSVVSSAVTPANGAETTSATFTFRWSPAADADASDTVTYWFRLDNDSGFGLVNQQIYVIWGGESAALTAELTKDVTYYWQVRARDNHGQYGAWSDTFSFTYRGTPPSLIDGSDTDWLGTPSNQGHDTVISQGEFIYTGAQDDQRTDLGDVNATDITEVRFKGDADYLYLLVRFKSIEAADSVHIGLGIDLDQSSSDSALTWLADQDDMSVGSPALYPETNVALHMTASGAKIEMYDQGGATWHAPTWGSADSIYISAPNKLLEAAIAWRDLAPVSLPQRIRFTLASFYNAVMWNNDGDATKDIAASADASDVMTPYCDSGLNAWNRDISDADFDSSITVNFNNTGKVNHYPDTPLSDTPSDATKFKLSETESGKSITLAWRLDDKDSADAKDSVVHLQVGRTAGGNDVLDTKLYGNDLDLIYTFSANDTYFWRVRHADDFGTSPFSADRKFSVVYEGPKWYVNDTSTAGDSYTTAVGADTAAGAIGSPFRTIIKALRSAAAGDTIWIDAGVYDSYVTVNTTETAGVNIDKDLITLIGKDSSSTVIDPPGANSVSGLYGIYADTQTNLTIKNLGVTGAYDGLRFDNVDSSTVSGDSVCGNGEYGIFLLSGSNNNTIGNNTADSNSSIGILISGSNYNTLDNNIANSNSNAGINFSSSSYDTASNNTTNLNGLAGIDLNGGSYYVVTGNTADTNSSHGIYLEGGTNNNTVSNNTTRGNLTTGIYLNAVDTNTLSGNTANSNGDGIKILNSHGNAVSGNVTNSDTYNGIVISASNGNTVETNTCNLNKLFGILLEDTSRYNTVRNNTVDTTTGSGIKLLRYCAYDTVTGNVTRWNSAQGIWLEDTSTNNQVTGNTANFNAGVGILLSGGSDSNTLKSDTANTNSDGIKLANSAGNTVSGNTANSDTFNGMVLSGANNNLVESNTIKSNLEIGIQIADASKNNTIRSNAVYSNTHAGLKFYSSDSNAVVQNEIAGGDTGIRIEGSSAGNLIAKNNIAGGAVNRVYNPGGLAQTLTRNWFGSADSVTIKNKISDTASAWTPWRLAAVDTQPSADTTAPKAPDTAAAANTDSAILVSWSAVTALEESNGGAVGLSGYRVYRSKTKDTSSWLKIGQVGAVTQFDDTDAAENTTYYYRVTAFDAATFENESFFSDSQPSDSVAKWTGPNWYVNDAWSSSADSFSYAGGADTYGGDGSASKPFRSLARVKQKDKAGDTIWQDAGTYGGDTWDMFSATDTAAVNLDTDNLTLIGKDSGATVIDPAGAKTVVDLYGIYADTQTGLVIRDLGVTGAYRGIFFIDVDRATLTNDSVCSNGNDGISLYGKSETNTVSNNIASWNTGDGVILSNFSNNNTVNDNTTNSNGYAGIHLYAITESDSPGQNTFRNNTSNLNAYGIRSDRGFDNTFIANTTNSNSNSGVYINGMSPNNLLVRNISRSNTLHGFYLWWDRFSTHTQNTAELNGEYQYYITAGSLSDTIQKNNIKPSAGNPDSGVYNASNMSFDFSRNYWGTTDSVAIDKMIYDTSGAKKITFQPYRLGSVDTAAGADTTAPKAPDTVAVVGAPSDTSIIVEWSAVSALEEVNGGAVGLSGYRVYRSAIKDTSSWVKIAQVGSGVLRYQDTDATLGSPYNYRVTAFDAATPFENESFFSDSQPTDSAQAQSRVNWYVNDASTAGDSFTYLTGSDATGEGTANKPFGTITKALSLATAGDTVWVDAGLYAEAVVIGNDSISVVGKDSAATVIDPPGSSGTAGVWGIYAAGRVSLSIRNLGVTGAYNGIRFDNVDRSTVSGDSVSACGNFAVYLLNGSDTNTLSKNEVVLNSNYGIALDASSGNTLSDNMSSSNSSSGINLGTSSNGNTITGNTTNSNTNYGIDLASSSVNTTVSNNTANSNTSAGIVAQTGNNTLTGNTANSNTDYGIWVDGGNANVIRGNVARSNASAGIRLNISDTNSVTLNEVSGSDTGIWIAGSSRNNEIQKNNIGGVSYLHNQSGLTQTITRNWFGATDEVTIAAKVSDTANAFRPYRLTKVDTASGADTTAPALPTGVTLDTSAAGQIKITWTIPAINEETNGGAVGFGGLNIYRLVNLVDTTNWANSVNLVKQTASTDTTWTDTTVTAGNTYYYRLTSKDAAAFLNESFFMDTRVTKPAYAGPVWYVNDTVTTGDSFTYQVGGDGGNGDAAAPFLTITKALSKAKAGDTIYIDAGTYTETVVINLDSVALIGKDSNATVIDPPGDSSSATNAKGITADTQTGLLIKNLAVRDAYWGIYFQNVDQSTITGDSACYNGQYGIYLYNGSDTNTVSGNVASSNGQTGIVLNGYTVANCDFNTVNNNTANSNKDAGIDVDGNANNNSIFGNTTNSNNVYGGIMILGNKNFVGNNTSLSNVNSGIRIYNADSNSIVQNELTGNDTGLWIVGSSSNNLITKNNVTGNNFSVANAGGTSQTLTRNWWGTTDEVAISAKFSDTASAFRPYRLAAVDTAAGADTTAPGKAVGVTLDTTVKGKITIKWTIPSLNEETNGGPVGFNGLNIYRLKDLVDTTNWANSANLVKQTSSTDTTWTDTNVFGGNTYYYRLTSKDAATFVNESFFTDTAAASPDTIVTVALVNPQDGHETTATSIPFSWSTSNDAETYTWQLSRTAAFTTLSDSVVDTTATSLIRSVTANDSYYWRVTGRDAAGNHDTPAARGFVIDTQTGQVTVSSPADGNQTNAPATVIWTAPADSVGIDSYVVEVSKSSAFTTTVSADTVDGAVTSQLLSGLYNDTYYWRVRAIDDVGNVGANSSVRGFVYDTAIAQVTSSSPADGAAQNRAGTVIWNAVTGDSSGIDSYVVEASKSSGFTSTISADTVDGAVTSQLLSGIYNDTYFWRVRAIDGAGNTGTNSAVRGFLLDTGVPAQVTASSPADAAQQNSAVTVIWSAVTGDSSGIDSYVVEVSKSSGFTSMISADTVDGAVTSQLLSGLYNDTYFWR
ncbi:right-handed parallel beta-helix repeat-containing protein, partial [bacterium]|nr:right-handed parallel beta-helix repeat-containing protein [bacterium]